MEEKINSLWLKLIKLISLMLLGVAAAVVLLPFIILSLQVVVIAGFLLAVGALGAWLSKGAAHLYLWFEKHHWVIHKHTGPPGLRAS